MRIVIVLVLLTSCNWYDDIRYIHQKAKENPNRTICYNLQYPEDLAGRFCIKYENN